MYLWYEIATLVFTVVSQCCFECSIGFEIFLMGDLDFHLNAHLDVVLKW